MTGSSGFIGGRIARDLLAREDRVRAMVRDPRRGRELAAGGAELAVADVADRSAVVRAARDCDAIVHCAGIPGPAPVKRFHAVHVQGTRHVVDAARQCGVRTLVNVSSDAAACAGRDALGLDGSEPYPERFIDPYSATKAAAEQVALEAHTEELRVVSVRPALVWGAGDSTVLPIMVRLARGPLGIPCVGDGRNLQATTHIDNLSQGVLAALDSERGGGRAFFLVDAFEVGWRDFFARQLEAVGTTPRFLRLPLAVAGPAAWILDHAAAAAHVTVPLAYFGVRMACTSHRYDSRPARTELGYRPFTGLDAGLDGLSRWGRARFGSSHAPAPGGAAPGRHKNHSRGRRVR